MNTLLKILIVVFIYQNLWSQGDYAYPTKVYFSEQISTNINAYKYKIGKAEAAQDYHKVAQLYNEFINQKLVGSYLDDFNVDCFSRKKNNLGDFEKPMVLLTYADWCGPIEEEILFFNHHVQQSNEHIDFLVLIWGNKKQARQLSKLFHRKTEILYVNELRNRDEHTIRMLKHALGVPTLIITNADKKIKHIIKVSPTFPNLFEHDFQQLFSEGIESLNIE